MALHCERALSKLNLLQRSKFLGEKCISSSVKSLSVYPMDLYSIYYVERWLKHNSYQKLLSLEMTVILKSFQSPSEKSHTSNRGERDNSLRAFCNRRSLTKLSRKFLTQSLWMQVIL